MLFARVPVPGRVKTRLADHLGGRGACALYGAFLEDAARIYRRDAEWDPVLLADPDPDDAAIAGIFSDGWRRRPQAAGALGERLTEGFRHELSRGASAAAAVGADHPSLRLARVREMFAALGRDADAVVIPAQDGGYCAIGVRASVGTRVAELFRGIPWSTGRVLEETVARFEDAGLTWRALPSAYDVDLPEDVDRLRAELDARDPTEEDYPAATARALALAAVPRRRDAPAVPA